MRRKLLSVVLCVCMMMTMVPFAFAEGNDAESGAGGTGSTIGGASGSGGGGAVAQIDTTTYNTLSEAIAAAENGKTITLLRDTSGQVLIPADKDITLDLSGKTITHTGTTVYNSGKLTICDSSENKSGKIISTGNVGVGVSHNSTTTIEYANIEAPEGAVITSYATGATIIIKDGIFSASDNAVIAGNGNNTDDKAVNKPVRVTPNKINILGGTFTGNIKTNGYIACGIYAPWKDIITVSGGNFIVNNGIGIVARAGQVTVTGGSFICNGTAKGKVGDKNFDMDAAQAVYFDASDPAYPAYNSETDYIKLLGGTFSSDVTNYVAENYACVQDNNTYTVKPLSEVAVAKIGDTLYATLSDAITASQSNDTITLLKDITTGMITVASDKTLTLNTNGKTITNSQGAYAINNLGTLTINGGGKIIRENAGNSAIRTIGTLTLENVTIETSDNKIAVKVDENGIGTKGILTVNEGTVLTAINGQAIQAWGDVTVNGGTMNGDVAAWSVKNWNTGNIVIKNGTVNGNVIAYQRLKDNVYPDQPAKVSIENGMFNGAPQIKYVEFTNDTIVDKDKTPFTVDGSITITGGYFTSDPSDYCVANKTGIPSNNSTYPFTVGTLTANVDVAPATPNAVAKTEGITDTNVKSAMTASAEAAKGTTATGLDAIGGKEATTITDNDITSATNKLSESGVTTTGQGTTVTLYVQPYLDITVTGAEVTPASTEGASPAITSLSLDIIPMVKKIASTATTANGIETGETGKNAVQIGEAQKVTIVNTPVTIKLALPDGFATDGQKLSVKHTKDNGSVEYYTGTVTTEPVQSSQSNGGTGSTSSASNTYVTFTTNGFSPFVIYAASANVASIGEGENQKVYPTLQAAIDAVQDGQTIKLTKNCSDSATVSRAVKFTLNKDSKTFTGSISAGSRYSVTSAVDSTDSNKTTYTVTYVGGSSSSGSTSTTYNVNVNAATNGTVAADKKTAAKGTTVTVTTTPSTGYVVDAVKVVDKDGKDIAVTVKDGKYVFTMPGSAVTVTATFKAETPAPSGLPFTDVKSGDWFYDAVKYAYENGLMNGTSATTFAPNGTMNRAMIVTVLYRLEKSPAVTSASKFTDVPAGQWYSDAVAWAAANNIVNGYDETTFGPMNAVTREQMATILYRYEQYKGMDTVTLEENLNRFPDKDKISAYALPALQWAVGQKIINGNADGTLNPTGTATRAQVAQIFTNLLNK